MHPTEAYQLYKYEHNRDLATAEQQAEAIRTGEIAAELRNLRPGLGRVFNLRHRAQSARRPADAVPRSPARGVPPAA